MKSDNKKLILRLLLENVSLSRKELAFRSGLTQAAVSKLTAELIAEGKITESGNAEGARRVGRKEIRLSLCLDRILFLGVYAEINGVTFSLGTLDGRMIAVRHIPFTDNVETLIREANNFLASEATDRSSLSRIGICVTGAVDDDSFGCWNAAGVGAAFAEAFGLPVETENNVKAFVLAQSYYGNVKKDESTLFFKWGPGVGSAYYAGGNVLSGDAGNVAEIGHYIVNPAGAKCRCGRYGCLETVCACDVIVRESGEESLDALLESTQTNVKLLLDHKINTVAVALTNTATILNAGNIVFFGSMFRAQDVSEKLKRQMLRYNGNLSGKEICVSGLNDQIAVVSPAAICAKRFLFSETEENI